tara:strand:- start:1990 stop:2694 length:705 start_codon:yes stop_codon:yes gene_type:complete
MDTPLLNTLRELSDKIINLFDSHLDRFDNERHINEFEGWTDLFWTSGPIRKAHLKIIEPIEGKPKLWLIHINIFPSNLMHYPILGLDVVAGPNKISGSFFDFSPVSDETHPIITTFGLATRDLVWKKERELPDWAKEIFSPYMVAAGNVREGEETEQFCEVALKLIAYYLQQIEHENFWANGGDHIHWHNNYCINQKKNKQLWNSLRAMNLDEDKINQYVNDVLFEELKPYPVD